MSTPVPALTPRTMYTAADITRAARQCAELRLLHPSWPRARIRATVARELNVSTTQLRYLLRQADERSEASLPDADALPLAA